LTADVQRIYRRLGDQEVLARAHHSAGAAKRRARSESDRETNPFAHQRFRLPVRSGRTAGRRCRPARRIVRASPGLLLSCFRALARQVCDG